jgi:predicted secreted protein
MATTVTLGIGCILALARSATPTTFVNMNEVYEISAPNAVRDKVDATHMGSTNQTREYIGGLIEPGDMSFTMAFVPNNASDAMCQAMQVSGEKGRAKITWPNGVTWTIDAIVMGYEPDTPIDGRMSATVSLQCSGVKTVA